jgi:hypothetical protein
MLCSLITNSIQTEFECDEGLRVKCVDDEVGKKWIGVTVFVRRESARYCALSAPVSF